MKIALMSMETSKFLKMKKNTKNVYKCSSGKMCLIFRKRKKLMKQIQYRIDLFRIGFYRLKAKKKKGGGLFLEEVKVIY